MPEIAVTGDRRGCNAVGRVRGLSRGTRIDTGYVNHQIVRLLSDYGFPVSSKSAPGPVEILGGIERGRTTGEDVVLRIGFPRGGARGQGRGATARNPPDPAGVVVRVACATLVRKALEDRGLFVGSHTLQIGSLRQRGTAPMQRMIRMLTRASCGAYKITEEADKAPGRILGRMSLPTSRESRRRPVSGIKNVPWMIALVFTGIPPRWAMDLLFQKSLRVALLRSVMADEIVTGISMLAMVPMSQYSRAAFRLTPERSPHRPGNRSADRGDSFAATFVIRYDPALRPSLFRWCSPPAYGVRLEAMAVLALREAVEISGLRL